MDLGDLIGLMHGARERYRTLEAEIREWTDLSLLGESWDRMAARRQPGSVAVLRLESDAGAEVPSQVPATREEFTHVWVEGPTRWRAKERGRDGWLSIRSGNSAWGGPPEHLEELDFPDIDIQPEEAIWDPALLIAELWLDPVAETTYLDRRAVAVQARPRPTERPGGEHFLLLEEADRYELIVDRQVGIVLQLTSLIRGEPMQLIEVRNLILDAPLDPELFSLPGGR